MHSMQSPETRHSMEKNVLEINRKVENNHRGDHTDPGWQREHVEQAKAASFCYKSKSDGRGWEQNTDKQGIHRHNAKIVRPPPAAPDHLLPARTDDFQNCQY